jgi:hypothetical protein
LKGVEVVAEIAPLPVGEINVYELGVMTEEAITDPIVVEQPSQEEWHGVTHRVSLTSELAKTNSEHLNLAVVTDEFDADTFVENVDTEQHIEEDVETARSEGDEGNVQPSVDTSSEGNEANAPSYVFTLCDVPTSSCIDWSSYYTDKELRALKFKHINLQDYLNHKDISHIGSTVCDSAIVDVEGKPRVQKEVIKKDQLFQLLDTVKFFFQDYVVRHHQPYYVAMSNKDVRYIMRCQISSCS